MNAFGGTVDERSERFRDDTYRWSPWLTEEVASWQFDYISYTVSIRLD